MNPYQWIWHYARRYKGRMVMAAVLIIGNALGIIVVPLLGGKIIDVVINQGHTEQLPWMIGNLVATGF